MNSTPACGPRERRVARWVPDRGGQAWLLLLLAAILFGQALARSDALIRANDRHLVNASLSGPTLDELFTPGKAGAASNLETESAFGQGPLALHDCSGPAPGVSPAVARPLYWSRVHGRELLVEQLQVRSEKLDLNRASVEELELVPGVGRSLALSIVMLREERGNFSSLQDLLEVRGIGERRLRELQSHLTVVPK